MRSRLPFSLLGVEVILENGTEDYDLHTYVCFKYLNTCCGFAAFFKSKGHPGADRSNHTSPI